MLNIVGSAPSSGSTLFADLLDSTPVSACGEELNIFANRRLYDFERFRRDALQASSLTSIYQFSERVNVNVLPFYGLDVRSFRELVASSATLADFISAFTTNFLALRGKSVQGVVFEKTPQNVNCMGAFLESVPDGSFVYAVRNPLNVFDSMKRRGFSSYVALVTWYLEGAKYFQFRNHERVHLVRYEDVVEAPYLETSRILKETAGFEVSEADIERGFRTNEYRKRFSIRMRSWTVQTTGTVANANKMELSPDTLGEFRALYNAMVNPAYARMLGMASVGLGELVAYFGYQEEIERALEGAPASARFPQPELRDRVRFFYRWLKALWRGEARVGALPIYLRPLAPLDH